MCSHIILSQLRMRGRALRHVCLCVTVHPFLGLLAATSGGCHGNSLFRVKIYKQRWATTLRNSTSFGRCWPTSCSVRWAMVWSRLLSSSLSCCTSCRRAWTLTHTNPHQDCSSFICFRVVFFFKRGEEQLTCVSEQWEESSGLGVSSFTSSSWAIITSLTLSIYSISSSNTYIT